MSRRSSSPWKASRRPRAALDDLSGEKKAEKKRDRARLEPALDAYDADLERRKVVKRGEVMSLLRRELKEPLGNVDLANLTRNDLVKRVRQTEASGRPGTAKELKTRAGVFMSWCVDHGTIPASPLAGWRRQRKTRAERIDKPGRALADWELPELWKAADAQGWPFGPYLKMLLLLGQRRTETALMAWSDLDLEAKIWTVPPQITKSGRPHKIPLPLQAVAILRTHKPAAKSDLVFPGRRNAPMTGWSKRLPAVYDRGDYWHLRVEAADSWAKHVMGAIEAAAAKVASGGSCPEPRRAR